MIIKLFPNFLPIFSFFLQYKKRVSKLVPRRSQRLLDKSSQRPLFLASRLDRRTAQTGATTALLQSTNPAAAAAAAAATGPFNIPMLSGLDELASLAATMDVGPPVPLPSDLGKPGAAAAAEMVVWRTPLPKTVRHFEIQAALDESSPIVAAHIHSSQYSELYRLIHQHVQLLAQSLALAVAQGDSASARAAKKMLVEFGEFSRQSTRERTMAGVPPYVASCLGIDEVQCGGHIGGLGVGGASFNTGNGGFGGGGAMRSNKRARNNNGSSSTAQERRNGTARSSIFSSWTPHNPGIVYTVADVAVLRTVPEVLQEMPDSTQGVLSPPPTLIFSPGESLPGLSSGGLEPLQVRMEDLEGGSGADGGGGGGGQGKKRRRGKGSEESKLWERLPHDVQMALVPMKRYFDPALEPRAPEFIVTSQIGFTPAEDALLAWGVRK